MIGDDSCYLDDKISTSIQTGHFQIYPNQPIVLISHALRPAIFMSVHSSTALPEQSARLYV
jgi:hypothetical protein